VREARVLLEASGDPAGVSEACAWLEAWLESVGMTTRRAMEWRQVLMEAGNNACAYARPEAKGMPIAMAMWCGATTVHAQVTDHTAGIEWPAEAKLPPVDSPHGRGIFLIQQLTDHSWYERGGETNRLVLVRGRETGHVGVTEPVEEGEEKGALET
jgi:anti-sigma regulatory factor (Ser/Thr protein kinase)